MLAVDPSSSQEPRQPLPRELTALLNATDAALEKRTWSQFVAAHSRLIMLVVRPLGHGYDDVMDRYSYVLDELKKDDLRRLRAYAARPTAKFEIWLVAVVRRLCVDYQRKKYGRSQSHGDTPPSASSAARRRLVDFIMRDIDVTPVPAPSSTNPETSLRQKELGHLLAQGLAGLTDADQLLLKLRFQDDVPVREIATIMHFQSVFAVYRRLKAALKELEMGLRRRGVEDVEP